MRTETELAAKGLWDAQLIAWEAHEQVKEIIEATTDKLAKERDAARAEVEAFKRGEFICAKCGIRKNDDYPAGDF